MAKKRKLTGEDVSKLLDESEDKCKETNSSTLDSINDGGIGHINGISGYEFSDQVIVDELFSNSRINVTYIFLRTQKQCGIFIQLVI